MKERDSCFSRYQSQGRRNEDLHIVTSLMDKVNEQIYNNKKSYFSNLLIKLMISGSTRKNTGPF